MLCNINYTFYVPEVSHRNIQYISDETLHKIAVAGERWGKKLRN